MDQDTLQKACDWLNDKCDGQFWPYAALNKHGTAYFKAYIFKIRRENKPSLYFEMEMVSSREYSRIKRICNY